MLPGNSFMSIFSFKFSKVLCYISCIRWYVLQVFWGHNIDILADFLIPPHFGCGSLKGSCECNCKDSAWKYKTKFMS